MNEDYHQWNDDEANNAYAHIQFLMRVRGRFAKRPELLYALETIPRALFVPRMFRRDAYAEQSITIAGGQTLEPPSVILQMIEALQVEERHTVLEIGTGSGYLAALLSCLVRRVYTIERIRDVRDEALQQCYALQRNNIVFLVGDGYQGWKDGAPYDRLVATAASPHVPSCWLEQLNDGGVLVMMLGGMHDEKKKMLRITRQGEQFITESLGDGACDMLHGAK